jgi:hypothetical protein
MPLVGILWVCPTVWSQHILLLCVNAWTDEAGRGEIQYSSYSVSDTVPYCTEHEQYCICSSRTVGNLVPSQVAKFPLLEKRTG